MRIFSMILFAVFMLMAIYFLINGEKEYAIIYLLLAAISNLYEIKEMIKK